MSIEEKLKILGGLTKIATGLIEEKLANENNVIEKLNHFLRKKELPPIIFEILKEVESDVLSSVKAKTIKPVPSARKNDVKPHSLTK